jgi:hypothetical protein
METSHCFLKGNNLYCSCENLNFIKWLTKTVIHLDSDGNNTCRLVNGTLSDTKKVMSNFHDIFHSCSATVWLNFGVVLIQTTIFLIVILNYTKNWECRLLVPVIPLDICLSISIKIDSELILDVYHLVIRWFFCVVTFTFLFKVAIANVSYFPSILNSCVFFVIIDFILLVFLLLFWFNIQSKQNKEERDDLNIRN